MVAGACKERSDWNHRITRQHSNAPRQGRSETGDDNTSDHFSAKGKPGRTRLRFVASRQAHFDLPP